MDVFKLKENMFIHKDEHENNCNHANLNLSDTIDEEVQAGIESKKEDEKEELKH